MAFFHDTFQFVRHKIKRILLMLDFLFGVGRLYCDSKDLLDLRREPCDVLTEHFGLFRVPFRRVFPRTVIHRHEKNNSIA